MNALEKHYRPKELAEMWALSPKTILRLFAEEPGVVRVTNLTSVNPRKRAYATISIPESVALRVHDSLSRVSLKSATLAQVQRRTPRVIKFRDIKKAA